ncbi:MAG: mycofactocin biosynthesis chaperone MftB [Actinomycetota bacterium]|nr:mycofactocin biosynthesis chaperone MftB [Actinomycetota bacterium]
MAIRLSKDFSYRREEFGGLFYNFNTRQLLLAKSQITVKVMDLLGSGSLSLGEVIESDDLSDFASSSIEATIDQLLAKGILTVTQESSELQIDREESHE